MARLRPVFVLVLAAAAACGPPPVVRAPAPPSMDQIAEAYVKLVLAVGRHDEHFVDAYYGPAGWRPAEDATPASLAALASERERLSAATATAPAPAEAMARLRHEYLRAQLAAVGARLRMLGGERLTFDEESKLLYDAVAPTHDEAYFRGLLADLEALLPGSGPLVARLDRFRAGFVVPAPKLDAVFRAAVEACRARTAAHLALPEGESFTIEYVKDKPWSGYNWYQGGYRSLIQVNTDLPIHVDRAIDLACHEGYPGHHAYNVLLEQHLVRERGWVEFTVYPLFSPQSLIAEGTANFGIEVAFPGEERVAFERDTLFPLAGLDASRAARYYEVMRVAERLSYAGNEAARRYLDGTVDAAGAVDWLTTYALMARPRAEQRLKFIETYRSYVINYNLGRDLVRQHVERHGGTPDQPARRWEVFGALLASPRLPSGL